MYIRGAITIEENSKDEIKKASIELFEKILIENNFNIEEISLIIFSCTNDITKDYPGKFIREKFNLSNVAIMHFNEMYVEGSLELCIRILIKTENEGKAKYIYLNNAKNLRKDLFKN